MNKDFLLSCFCQPPPTPKDTVPQESGWPCLLTTVESLMSLGWSSCSKIILVCHTCAILCSSLCAPILLYKMEDPLKVFVGGLHKHLNKPNVLEMLGQYGFVPLDVHMPQNHPGTAFVVFHTSEEARQCCRCFDAVKDYKWSEHPLQVSWAKMGVYSCYIL